MNKHVISVSLGSSTRDKYIETRLLNQPVIIERRGTDGDIHKAKSMLASLKDKIDAFGLGGTDLFVQVAGKRYKVRDAQAIAKHAAPTPIVCGAGLKDSLERRVVNELNESLNWRTQKVLLVSASDRFGMAEAITDHGADCIYADLIFLLGIDKPLKDLAGLARVTALIGPLVTKLPMSWLYPIGKSQESSESNNWRAKYFHDVDVIAGDFHFIKRYAPEDLTGKIILTNTTTEADLELMKQRGVAQLITTTPRFDGRSLSTNMLEAAFVAIKGEYPLSSEDYEVMIRESGIKPDQQVFI